jgi:hypothetical protein
MELQFNQLIKHTHFMRGILSKKIVENFGNSNSWLNFEVNFLLNALITIQNLFSFWILRLNSTRKLNSIII